MSPNYTKKAKIKGLELSSKNILCFALRISQVPSFLPKWTTYTSWECFSGPPPSFTNLFTSKQKRFTWLFCLMLTLLKIFKSSYQSWDTIGQCKGICLFCRLTTLASLSRLSYLLQKAYPFSVSCFESTESHRWRPTVCCLPGNAIRPPKIHTTLL